MDESKKEIYRRLTDKYNSKTFMYIEYPHKSFWREDFNENDFKKGLESLGGENKGEPLLLYVHIPFCPQRCFYCTCHTSVSNDHEKIKKYLKFLYKEMDLFQNFFDKKRITPNFTEIHLGGGSPTHLNIEEFDSLIKRIHSFVDIGKLGEFSIEIDPRYTDRERMFYYWSKGINRISFGVQDFDPQVQKAINRIQPPEMIEDLINPDIRRLFKKGVNFDIICGLPNQTPKSIKKTFEKILDMSPDRVCFNYLDYAPKFFRHQEFMIDGKNGRPTKLPDNYERKILFTTGLETLTEGGYLRTGYDHFAKPEDEIAKAMLEGRMRWNALGVTAGRYSNVIGIGPHSASTVGNYYSQNVYGVENYQEIVEKDTIPSFRGHRLDKDDLIRREVIQTIRNFFFLNYEKIERKYDINFKRYFKKEISFLEKFVEDGLLKKTDKSIGVTDLGKDFVLFICKTFDAYIEN